MAPLEVYALFLWVKEVEIIAKGLDPETGEMGKRPVVDRQDPPAKAARASTSPKRQDSGKGSLKCRKFGGLGHRHDQLVFPKFEPRGEKQRKTFQKWLVNKANKDSDKDNISKEKKTGERKKEAEKKPKDEESDTDS